MKTVLLHNKDTKVAFLVDKAADTGLVKVAGKVANDYNLITGEKEKPKKVAKLDEKTPSVFAGIVGESEILDKLEKEGKVNLKDVTGKWEVYKMTVVGNAIVIAGSDKLGAIYGLFTLSELMGVSPLCWIADSVIPKKKVLKVDINEKATKEPSVKFRGFFINDEWPCFGNWTFEHFGGFTAEMYDHVFELLLRLKGNYLWPAMWSSSFAWDGPGLKSYELATEYGIYIGNSHHEPCLRAGEEYRHVRGKDSIYGDAWNYHANTKGITRFWKDSMDERGMFTSVVTVGMRGEADTTILGANATLKDNIDLLKDVIVCQKKIIKETEKKYNKTFPKVLALYKEVEPFYYGDKDTEGLCDWDELDDVILMLCEDNHGYLRTVPDDKMRNHPAGFGMYYHVDYHGDPISYEWINSSPLPLMWEQMSQAYDYGVRSIWILNVGDLKHNEFPLSYFLNLAYDFDKWGTKAPNTTFKYTKEALKLHFGDKLSDAQVKTAADILTETVRINGLRRPEALNEDTYHPCHFEEADEMIKRVDALEKKLAKFEENLSEECFKAWYSLEGFQTRATITLLRMQLFGAKNKLYAKQGLKSANDYADAVYEEIIEDKELKKDWAKFNNGKWKGHELASHVGFRKWNDDGARYPNQSYIEPFDAPRLFVMRADSEEIYDKVYGPVMRMHVNDFMFDEEDTVRIKVANTGVKRITVKVELPDAKWLSVDKKELNVVNEAIITFKCDKSKLKGEKEETALVKVSDANTTVEIEFKAANQFAKVKKGVVIPGRFGYCIEAKNFKTEAPKGFEWKELKDYGFFGSGMKVYPVVAKYKRGLEPALSKDIYVKDPGEYTLEVVFTPTNPLTRDKKLGYKVSLNGEEGKVYNTVSKDYKIGSGRDVEWGSGVLNKRRNCKSKITLKEGVNSIKLSMMDAGLVPLRVYIYKDEPPVSYLGIKPTKEM